MKSVKRILFDNLGLKLLSLALAITFFVFVRSDHDTVMSIYVQVLVRVPEGKVLTSDSVDRVRLTVRGKWSKIRDLGSRDLPLLEVDLSGHDDGDFYFDEELFPLPSGVKVVSFQPASMRVRLTDSASTEVPVRVVLVGTPDEEVEFLGAEVAPENTKMVGAQRIVEALERVETVPVDLSGRKETVSLKVQMVRPLPGVQFERESARGIPMAHVTLRFQDRVERRRLRVPVRVVGTTYDTELRPAEAELVLEGPVRLLNSLDPDEIIPFIDASEMDGKPPGTHRLRLQVDNMPPGINISGRRPEIIHLTTTGRSAEEQ